MKWLVYKQTVLECLYTQAKPLLKSKIIKVKKREYPNVYSVTLNLLDSGFYLNHVWKCLMHS